MSRTSQLSPYRTKWTATSDSISGSVTYIRTTIVEWNEREITLRSGEWQTYTTKRKMNQAAQQFGLSFAVYQLDFAWFVTLPDGTEVPFQDGMTFPRPC